ncbi:uncharacterized protein LOC103665909 [Ursus maritimus]|uniref:Uncharacterized protein LOC103665909 n=1 Tax=Ursus maritimus TaxID=29073 RepID=A0A384CCL7_URSMA|nr:uncharacterized protein LOC103665909 [Ursus maritimus]XP_026369000.2 uncharacterized protein LOC113265665 [Ursus arctos]
MRSQARSLRQILPLSPEAPRGSRRDQTPPPGGRWAQAQRMLISPRRGALIGWRGFQWLSRGGGRGRVKGRRRRQQQPPQPGTPGHPPPPGRQGVCGPRGRLRRGLPLLWSARVLLLNPSRVRDDDPTPRPTVQAEDGISAEGFQAAGWSRRISNVWAKCRRVQSFLCAQARLFRAAPSNSGDPRGHLHVNAPRVALLPSPGSLPSYPLPLPRISPVTNTMRSHYYPQFYRLKNQRKTQRARDGAQNVKPEDPVITESGALATHRWHRLWHRPGPG